MMYVDDLSLMAEIRFDREADAGVGSYCGFGMVCSIHRIKMV